MKLRHYQYLDPHCLLVINTQGVLKKLYTPFRVQCVKTIEQIPKGSWVIVEEVHSSSEGVLLYRIQDRLISYQHFRVQIRF